LVSAESLMFSESAPPETLLTLTGPPMPASEPLPTTTLSLAVLLTVTALLEPQILTVLLPTPIDCAPGLSVRGVLAAVPYPLLMLPPWPPSTSSDVTPEVALKPPV